MAQCPEGDSDDAVPQGSGTVSYLHQWHSGIQVHPWQGCRWPQAEQCSWHTWWMGCHTEAWMPYRGTWTHVTSGCMERPWSSVRPSANCCTWVRATPSINPDWGMNELRACRRRTWACWQIESSTQTDRVRQKAGPASWITPKETWPPG